MKDKKKTKDQLINELVELRQRIAGLEASEAERKPAEEDLRESNARYKAFFDRTLYCVYVHNLEGRFIDANDAALNLLCYKREDIPSVKFSTLLEEDQLPIAFKNMEELLQTGSQKEPIEYKLRKKDGGYVWIEAEGSLIYKEGKPYAIQGIARDITERKLAEKALIDSEERYRRMVSAITAYTYSVEVKNGQTIFTHHSIGCLPVTGYKPEDYESEPYLWYTMIHPEDQILVGNSLNEILAGREVPPIEHRLIRRDGSIVWVRNTMVPYLDEEGRLIRYDGLIEDITGRKRAEEAMQESESKFRTLAQTNAAAIFIIQGNNFQYVNPALEAFTGYSEEELLTMNFWDIVHHEFQELVQDRGLRRQRGEKVPLRYEFKIVTKSGETRWLDTTAGLIEYNGKPATITVAFETTDRKHAEEALRESEEKFRAISSTAVDAILVMDNEGKILYWNPE